MSPRGDKKSGLAGLSQVWSIAVAVQVIDMSGKEPKVLPTRARRPGNWYQLALGNIFPISKKPIVHFRPEVLDDLRSLEDRQPMGSR